LRVACSGANWRFQWQSDRVDTSEQVGDKTHLEVFANAEAAEARFEQYDLEGVAFDYDVLE